MCTEVLQTVWTPGLNPIKLITISSKKKKIPFFFIKCYMRERKEQEPGAEEHPYGTILICAFKFTPSNVNLLCHTCLYDAYIKKHRGP